MQSVQVLTLNYPFDAALSDGPLPLFGGPFIHKPELSTNKGFFITR